MRSWEPSLGLPLGDARRVAEVALAEDSPWGDVTSEALLPAGVRALGSMVARGRGVLAGLRVAEAAFAAADPEVRFHPLEVDGAVVEPGDHVATVAGPARAILRAERVALNLLQRLSGIATLTARFVAAVDGTGARIVDTRKTTPGLRALERYAVRAGGGHNHRWSLSDAVLVKDNHVAALAARGVPLAEAVRAARRSLPHTVTVQVEVDRLDQIDAALEGGADAVLLDNMTPEQLRTAVGMVAGRAVVEASGGVSLDTVRAIAETGVDVISVGALTHSAPALDIALEVVTTEPAR